MSVSTLTLTLLLCFTSCQALTCGDANQTFYYADISTGCQVYHFCENSELKTLTCPNGQAFDRKTSTCENATTVICYEILKFPTSQQATEHKRSKRQAPVPDVLHNLVGPVVKPMLRFMAVSLLGSENTVTSKVILPVVYDMVDNPLSRRDLFSLFFSAKYAFGPLVREIFRYQSFSVPEGTVVQVPRKYYDRAMFRFFTETKPILKRLAGRHLQKFFYLAAENVPIILETIQRLQAAKYHHAEDLKDAILNFVTKHGGLFKTSTDTHVNFYSMPEIVKDIFPIKVLLFEITIEYLRQHPASVVNAFFGDNYLLQGQFIGTPMFARSLHQRVNPVSLQRNLRTMWRRY